MVEIYNELFGICEPKSHETTSYNDRQRGVIIQGVKEEIVASPERYELLDTGFGNRAVEALG